MATLLATTALTAPLLITPALAQNLPTGGSVAAGSVAVAQPSATQLNIVQSSQSAVVNWQSFSIGAGSAVNIVQPNASSAILNRVTGNTPSSIAGSLTANGQVYLVNPNGIAITSSGTVNTGGGFVASTLGITDSDFMAGRRNFSGNGSSADVSNAGAIRVGRGGYAALIGGTVSNSGSIDVPLGRVGLGSGEQATLDFAGDGFLQVAVPTKAGGADALIRNSGRIRANGGSITMSAATAREAARNAVNISGLVQARSISGHNGAIVIGGGAGGRVAVSGRVSTAARRGTGGKIAITGQDIALTGARIDASGGAGGGTINIGGNYQGQGPLQRADSVSIDAATTIRADATQTGRGGNVVVWSDQRTSFAGTITARGGREGGDGGNAEVSGKAVLDYRGFADLSATNGAFGTLLLDPYNVIISTGVNNTGGSFTANTNDSIINVTTLQNQLAGANVTITTGAGGAQAGDITIAAPLTWASGSTLTLNAYHSIAVNAPVTIAGAGGLDLTINNGGSGGTLSFAGGVQYTGTPNSGQSLTINGTPYTLLYSMSDMEGTNRTGNSALARNLDASGRTYTHALIGPDFDYQFDGTFEGLGNTISNLRVTATGGYGGLFGVIHGVVRDLGLVGAAISAPGGGAGGLAVRNYYGGTIINCYVTGTVGAALGLDGGLVAWNHGLIINSYSTATVSGTTGSNVGGLVGWNDWSGTILNSHASGAVIGGPEHYPVGSVGGLVGQNNGTISNSYATGAVYGGYNADSGGLVGWAGSNGTISNSYWDAQTSGPGNSSSPGGTALTTAQLQGALPAGFDPAVWGTGPGLYPYLKSFFPNGAQAISGIAYTDGGNTPLASAAAPGVVSARVNGTSLAPVTTGANGYYYFLVPAGTINGSSVLVYTTAAGNAPGAKDGATLVTGASGTQTGLNVLGSWLSEQADASVTSLSRLNQAYATAAAGTPAANFALPNRMIGFAAANFAIDQPAWQPVGTLIFNAGAGSVATQTQPIGAQILYLLGGSYTLTDAANQIGVLVAAANSVTLSDAANLIVAGVTTSGAVTLSSAGDLTILSGAKVSGANPVLAAGGKFINNQGTDAVTATTGRWLIYSNNPAGDTFGGLDSANTAIWDATLATLPPGAVTPGGNRYLFAFQPTLTLTSSDVSKTYGDDGAAQLANAYTVTGLQAGVAGAFLGDTVATAFSSAPTLTSPGAAATASVAGSPYAINLGSIATRYGLQFVASGRLTVTPRPITVTADQRSRVYGDANPGLTFTVGGAGLANGDMLTGALMTSAGAASGVGSYAITQGSLTDTANPNYAITYVGANLTVTPRPITVTADQQSRVYGDANPLTFAVGGAGLVNGDALSGALTTNAGPASGVGVGSHGITQGSLTDIANPNYAITYVGANLTVTPRPITVTADPQSRTTGQANPPLTFTVGGEGLVNGDVLSGVQATDATSDSPVGTYAITQGSLAASANYTLTYVGGVLTVMPAPVSDSASGVVRDQLSWLAPPSQPGPLLDGQPKLDARGIGLFYADPRSDRICYGGLTCFSTTGQDAAP